MKKVIKTSNKRLVALISLIHCCQTFFNFRVFRKMKSKILTEGVCQKDEDCCQHICPVWYWRYVRAIWIGRVKIVIHYHEHYCCNHCEGETRKSQQIWSNLLWTELKIWCSLCRCFFKKWFMCYIFLKCYFHIWYDLWCPQTEITETWKFLFLRYLNLLHRRTQSNLLTYLKNIPRLPNSRMGAWHICWVLLYLCSYTVKK